MATSGGKKREEEGQHVKGINGLPRQYGAVFLKPG